jgi:hypothetical protein
MLASAAGAAASSARLTVLLGHGGDSGGVGEEQRGRSGRERDGRRSARRRTRHGDWDGWVGGGRGEGKKRAARAGLTGGSGWLRVGGVYLKQVN